MHETKTAGLHLVQVRVIVYRVVGKKKWMDSVMVKKHPIVRVALRIRCSFRTTKETILLIMLTYFHIEDSSFVCYDSKNMDKHIDAKDNTQS